MKKTIKSTDIPLTEGQVPSLATTETKSSVEDDWRQVKIGNHIVLKKGNKIKTPWSEEQATLGKNYPQDKEEECDHICSGNCRRSGCNCNCGEWHADPCGACGGTGEITTMERVYANEPHMAPIGTAPCPECKPPNEDYDECE